MIFQCYYEDDKGVRCKKKQKTEFCSEEHHQAWADKNYPKKKVKTQEEIMAGLKKIAQQRRIQRNGGQGELL